MSTSLSDFLFTILSVTLPTTLSTTLSTTTLTTLFKFSAFSGNCGSNWAGFGRHFLQPKLSEGLPFEMIRLKIMFHWAGSPISSRAHLSSKAKPSHPAIQPSFYFHNIENTKTKLLLPQYQNHKKLRSKYARPWPRSFHFEICH